MESILMALLVLSPVVNAPEPRTASLAEVKDAVHIIENTNCVEPTKERLEALNVIKAAADQLTPRKFQEFLANTAMPDTLDTVYQEQPILYWYDHVIDKIIAEIQTDIVPKGEVHCWLLYNLGYVFKTSESCFGVDISHRRGSELVPFLDFTVVTHNHDDHYTPRFLAAMNRQRKPVLSNFYPNTGYEGTDDNAGFFAGPTRTLKIKDVTISTYESDHNAKLRRFVQPAEFSIGDEGNRIVIFAGGDSCNELQLHSSYSKVNAFLVHPYVGLKSEIAADKLNAELVLISHLEEFGHAVEQWRWTWRQGYEKAKVVQEHKHKAYVPLWGDKIILKN